MSLEDDLRRMGEARAAQAHEADWRAMKATSRSRWWLGAAAAAAILVAVVGGIALVATDDDSPDLATADPDPVTNGEIERWIPPGTVTTIEYGLSPFTVWGLVGPGQEVALVTTPEDATEPLDDDWTVVIVDPPWQFRGVDDAPDGPTEFDGRADFRFRTPDGRVVLLMSRRFTASDLTEARPRLEALGGDLNGLTAEIASWDPELQAVHVGAATGVEAVISTEDAASDGSVVGWLGGGSEMQFVATYRWGLDDLSTLLGEAFAVADTGLFNSSYFAFPADRPPERVTEPEWDSVVEGLIDGDEAVILAGDPGTGERRPLGPVTASVTDHEGHHTVRFTLDDATTLTEGGQVVAVVGGISLYSEWIAPGQGTDAVIVPARMSLEEAERYVALINARETDQPGPCAANPPPSPQVLDLAVHLAADRNPLDLDQDGVDDEMLAYEDGDGWWVIARLRTGWTTPAYVGTQWPTELVQRPGGAGPASADLDGDGQLEFFVTATGNTARNAAIFSLTGCELVRVAYRDNPAEDAEFEGLLLVGVGGGSCAPTGCWPRVSCPAPGELLVEIAEPTTGGEVVWTSTSWRLIGDLLVEEATGEERFDAGAVPVDAPGPESSDLIDC